MYHHPRPAVRAGDNVPQGADSLPCRRALRRPIRPPRIPPGGAGLLAALEAHLLGDLRPLRDRMANGFALLLRALRDAGIRPSTADDVASEVLLQAWRTAGAHRPVANELAWLARVAWTAFLRSATGQRRAPNLGEAADGVADEHDPVAAALDVWVAPGGESAYVSQWEPHRSEY